MKAVILAAGKASRMEGVAPHGCKSLVPLAGKTVLEHQLDRLQGWDVTVVCHPTHVEHLERFPVRLATDPTYGGPVSALAASGALGLTLIVYSDTLFDQVPVCRPEWVAMAMGRGPREYDAWTRDGWGRLPLGPMSNLAVCAGLYRLELAEDDFSCPDMPAVLNRRNNLRIAPVSGWRDVGTKDQWAYVTSQLAA